MIRFSNTVDIARQPAEVFAYLADLEHTPAWNGAISSTRKLSPGPVDVGTRYQQTRSVPRPGVEMLEVTGFEPDRRIEVVGNLGPFRAHLTYELSPKASGTRLTNSVELDPTGVISMIGGLFSGRIRASVAENLGVLRILLEAGV
ncbi:MAG: SRPBCC family protein [Chloroflexota bacterium]|nr:SRPBCC family protein [Chloroflexota bacterium]MDQ2941654.1 SRPBCC family protein [Chloroflexota bacterium]